MTDLNSLISIQINRATATVQRASFAIPCFIAAHVGFADRAKEYTSTTEVAVDFTTTSNVYKAASKYFSQGKGLKTLVVGRRQVPSVTITPTAADNTVYSFKLNGTSISITSGTSATATTIVTALKAAISSAGITDPVASGTSTLVLTSANGYSVTNLSTNLSMAAASPTETWADTITAVKGGNDSWFHLSTETHVDNDILAIAAAIETYGGDKQYVVGSQSSGIKTSSTSDIASQLKALNYANTRMIYSADADANFIECAWVGYFAPQQVGSTHWCYKTLSGIVADKLNSSESGYILGKNCSTYEANIGGQDVVVGGKVASGEWADVMDGVAWLKARLQEGIWFQQVNSPKIGYTAAGAAIIEAEVRRVVIEAIQVGILAEAPAPTISVPNVLNVAPAVRATRVLPDVTFEARLAGAIMYIDGITGTVYA